MRNERPKPAENFQVEEQNLAKAGAEAERKVLAAVLASTEYNKTLAARVLGISRNKLYKKMRDLGLHSATDGSALAKKASDDARRGRELLHPVQPPTKRLHSRHRNTG